VESSESRAGPFAEAGAGVGDLLDHLVCDGERRWRHLDPSALAVCRFITNSNLVDCWTAGRPA
jgi:hypothetical protein